MKVIDLLNKIANGELEENTRFYDKYVHKEYIFKPKSYAGIYPENNARADENWYLTLGSGTFRLMQEVEIIEDTPEETTISEEQVLFNNLDSVDRERIIQLMKILQPPKANVVISIDYSNCGE